MPLTKSAGQPAPTLATRHYFVRAAPMGTAVSDTGHTPASSISHQPTNRRYSPRVLNRQVAAGFGKAPAKVQQQGHRGTGITVQ